MSTDLGPLYLGDVYKQAARFGGQLDTTLRAFGDWFGTDTPLLASSQAIGVSGHMYVELDPDSNDNSALIESFDTVAGLTGAYDTLVFAKSGSYMVGPTDISNIGRIIHEIDVVLDLPDGTDDQTSMFDIKRSRFRYDLYGRITGSASQQGSATEQRAIHSYVFDDVVVDGHCVGVITDFKGLGVWLRDGDSLTIRNLTISQCTQTCALISTQTKNIKNAVIDGVIANNDGLDAGTLKIFRLGNDDYSITTGGIYNSWSESDSTGTSVEIWAGNGHWHYDLHVINTRHNGGVYGISVNRTQGGTIQRCRITGFSGPGAELAGCPGGYVAGNEIEGNGGSITTGISIDMGSTESGAGGTLEAVRAWGNKIKGCKTGISTGGNVNSGTYYGDRILIGINNIESSVADANGITNSYGRTVIVLANDIVLTGAVTSNGNAIVSFNENQKLIVRSNICAVAASGCGIKLVSTTYYDVDGNIIVCPSGAGGSAYTLLNTQHGRCLGGEINGTFTNGCNLFADGSGQTSDHNIIGDWVGVGGSASINTGALNSGTFGTHNRSKPIEGWLPGNAEYAWFIRLAASFNDWVWGGGVLTGAVPTSGPLFGGNGSVIQVLDDGTANNNVPWALKSGTWTAMV